MLMPSKGVTVIANAYCNACRTSPSLQPHCSSPAGEQPPTGPGGGAPDGGSLLANLGLWGLWAGLAAYAFLVAPNQTPLRDAYFLEKLVGLVGWGVRRQGWARGGSGSQPAARVAPVQLRLVASERLCWDHRTSHALLLFPWLPQGVDDGVTLNVIVTNLFLVMGEAASREAEQSQGLH